MDHGRLTSARSRYRRSLAGLAGGAFRFFLFGNLFLALCAALWTYSTYGVLHDAPGAANPWLSAFVAAGVVVVYTIDRVFPGERHDAATASERHRWIARHRRSLLALLACAAAVVLVALPFLGAGVLALAGVAGALALAYSLPVRRGRTAGLRSFGLLKIFLIAAVWAVVTTILPPLDAGDAVLTRDVCLLFVERFLFVFAITLPFDIRDRALDLASGVRTIPVRVGTSASKAIVGAAIVAYLALKVAHYGLRTPLALAPSAVSAGYVALLLVALSEGRRDYYFSLLWDGAILVQATLALAFARAGGP
jgi:4-hydroxybenzoate polyprenyltransferase